MKKILSLLAMVIFSVVITGCFASDTTLEFVSLPLSVYELAGESGQIDLSEVEIKIDGLTMTVSQAITNGAIVTGDTFTTTGPHTLMIKYKTATISFNYVVTQGDITEDTTYKIDWYVGKNSPFIISSAEDLRGLAEIVNGTAKNAQGALITADSFENKEVRLAANINLGNKGWTPIGEGRRKDFSGRDTGAPDNNVQTVYDWKYFSGTFDGRGYTISGLTDVGYTPSVAGDYLKSDGTQMDKGYVFGLFGITFNAVIKNIKMADVGIYGVTSINLQTGEYVVYNGDSVSAVVGYACGSIAIDNVEILNGVIIGADAVGGVLGRAYYNTTFSITNCTNRANITATFYSNVKVGGVFGFVSSSIDPVTLKEDWTLMKDYSVSNNTNYGKVTLSNNFSNGTGHIGGITSSYSLCEGGHSLADNNQNYGDLIFNRDLFNKTTGVSTSVRVQVWDNDHCDDCEKTNHHHHYWYK